MKNFFVSDQLKIFIFIAISVIFYVIGAIAFMHLLSREVARKSCTTLQQTLHCESE